ncbi:hydroxyphenylacetyl-CoA thioesterase PaaI [Comamonas resistens]|mgnify:FL=1|uniref:Hydroxyphenylacetyl-CoA thioesterase PaaI n=1 Tax=Comamonas resistens TaxID=3046670 RepID=A0ABY8SSC5_9BURK|nr:hydroxyphenylacetyl-CoA thioesterase PaaI [Comamonas resistens]MDL5038681.1 hydroxyphenylacetyl-CoA thioesterase PaaI [Comamonas resistens]WHS65954.1 hydroxyphenylacetyl-CoA thioesterase PaaI [Comamonas resistens]
MTPQQTAELVRDGMFARDRAAQSLAMRITHIAPGEATIEMPVRDDMLNGFDTCHGGYITALGDTAFAYACNTRNEMTVASGLSVDFVAPGRPGDVLVAQARELSQAGRTGVYDVTIRNHQGQLIALFRGKSYSMKGKPTVPAQAA